MNSQLHRFPVHPLSIDEVLEVVTWWVSNRRRPPAFIVQFNAYTYVNIRENPNYADALIDADLSVADGMPIVWLLRRRGYKAARRVYGPDLMIAICEEAALNGWRCFLYGGSPGVPELLKQALLTRFPALKIVGCYSPPFRELTREEDEDICLRINATMPDLVFVGLGGPKQDLWMHEHRSRIHASVIHGVGAAFDFISGRLPQAPRWMMNAGLEWLFRLALEPRRLWKRYTLSNAKFLFYALRYEFVKRS